MTATCTRPYRDLKKNQADFSEDPWGSNGLPNEPISPVGIHGKMVYLPT